MINKIKKSKYHKTFSEGILVLFDQGLLSIATFVTGILIAKGTSKEEFGVYILCWSFLNISITFSEATISRPFALLLPKLDSKERNTYQGSSLIHTVLFCTTLSAAMLISLFVVNDRSPGRFTFDIILATAITTFPYILRRFMRTSSLARLHISAGVLANAIASGLQILILFLLFRYELISVTFAYYVIAACSSIAAIMIFIKEKQYFSIQLNRVYDDFIRSWKTGKWLTVNAGAFTVVSQIYPWLLAIILDMENIAIYGACMSVSAVAAPLLRGLDSYILPRMTHGLHNDGQEALYKILKNATIIVSIPYILWFIIGTSLADFLLINLYSKEYGGHAILLGLLLFKNLIDSSSTPVTNAILALGETRHTSIALLYGTVTTIILGPTLIQSIGLEGAGLAAVISALVIAGYKWHIIFKLNKTKTAKNGTI